MIPEKALGMFEKKSEKSRRRQQDPRRLIATIHFTADGEVVEKSVTGLDGRILVSPYFIFLVMLQSTRAGVDVII